KQRVALRCEVKALPNVEETAQYINTRLKVAGTEYTDIFSPGAVDYIFRCSEGIPRNINNLCDNVLLNGFAAGEAIISRAAVQEVVAVLAGQGLGRGTFGRGYGALEAAGFAPRNSTKASVGRNWHSDNVPYFRPEPGHGPPGEGPPLTAMPAAYNSASTAHAD